MYILIGCVIIASSIVLSAVILAATGKSTVRMVIGPNWHTSTSNTSEWGENAE